MIWKKYLYIGGAAALLTGWGVSVYKAYDYGYGKAESVCQTNTLEEVEKALDKQAVDHLKHLNRALERAKQERVIEKEIEKVYVEIPKVVEKIIKERPDCADLGLDALKLWNKPISQAYRSGESDKGKASPRSSFVNPVSATSRSYQF